MTPAERARAWFRRHARPRFAVPGGEVVAYCVDWSEGVEASLAALLAGSPEPEADGHPPWSWEPDPQGVTKTNYQEPR